MGDEFLTKAEGFLKGQKDSSNYPVDSLFTKDNFDLKIFAGSSLDHFRSPLGRMRNQLVKAIQQEILLPKLVVVIPDVDLINAIPYEGYGISDIYGRIVHWLAAEYNKIIECHKDNLQNKSLKEDYPQFVWFPPPQNKNFSENALRSKFAKSVKASLHIQRNHMMLKLIKIWTYDNDNLATNSSYTPEGFRKFWASVDSAITFWANNLAPGRKASKLDQQQSHMEGPLPSYPHEGYQVPFVRDKYHWTARNRRGRNVTNPPMQHRR